MSYCRFENTFRDLKDCQEALNDGLDKLYESERKFAKWLIEACKEISDDHYNEREEKWEAITTT